MRNPTHPDVNLHITRSECTHTYVNTPNIAFSLSQLRSEGRDVEPGVTSGERRKIAVGEHPEINHIHV